MFAARGHPQIVSLLLRRGAHVDRVAADGSTALHIAAAQGRYYVNFHLHLTHFYHVESGGAEILTALLAAVSAESRARIVNLVDGALLCLSASVIT